MSNLQAIADRVEIEALRGEFTDAAMMRDYDRFASLFTQDGVADAPHQRGVRQPGGDPGRDRVGQGLWDYFVQNAHRARSRLRAIPRSAVHTSQSSAAFATAART